MADKPERIKLTTPEFRGSYVNLVKARKVDKDNDEEQAKYGMLIVLSKEVKANRIFVKKLRAAIEEASAAKHGKALPENKLKHYPIQDGDDSENEDFHGHYLIRASSRFKPQCIDKSGEDIIAEDELYSGAWYRANVSPWGWANKKGGKGVSIGLNSVMKVKDDDKLGGQGNAKEDFKDHISEDDADDEDSDEDDDSRFD